MKQGGFNSSHVDFTAAAAARVTKEIFDRIPAIIGALRKTCAVTASMDFVKDAVYSLSKMTLQATKAIFWLALSICTRSLKVDNGRRLIAQIQGVAAIPDFVSLHCHEKSFFAALSIDGDATKIFRDPASAFLGSRSILFPSDSVVSAAKHVFTGAMPVFTASNRSSLRQRKPSSSQKKSAARRRRSSLRRNKPTT